MLGLGRHSSFKTSAELSAVNATSTHQEIPSISVYGCGLALPRPQNAEKTSNRLADFIQSMWTGEKALRPSGYFHGGQLVGNATFDFEDYRAWISERVNEKRFMQLQKSAGQVVQFAVGAVIDAIESSQGLLSLIKSNPNRVATLVGTGLGEIEQSIEAHKSLSRASFEWNAFWGKESAQQAIKNGSLPDGLSDPSKIEDEYEAFEGLGRVYAYYCERNPQLTQFIEEYAAIESRPLEMGGESSLINQLKAKASERLLLRRRYKAPMPPWESVNANVLWNIPNLAAAQISMLLGTHGLTAGLSGACCTFSLCLRAGLDEIRSGRADVAIIGASDGDPRPEIMAAFHAARVGAFGPGVVEPMTQLRGTHLSGGACIWILCRDDVARDHGLQSLGLKVRGVSVTSDAEHVITPSAEGPLYAARLALKEAGVEPSRVQSWDLHCTGTPGDVQEVEHLRHLASEQALLTARKGLFGHGMGACGGWELTAQLLAPRYETGGFIVPPSWIPKDEISPAIREKKMRLALDEPVRIEAQHESEEDSKSRLLCAKLSMGVGGVSSCVVCERIEERSRC